jgi:hypothetical protein
MTTWEKLGSRGGNVKCGTARTLLKGMIGAVNPGGNPMNVGHSKHRADTVVMVRIGLTSLALVAALLPPKDADACGACYASNNESTVVSDHKMALSISKQRTILWDQIQYSGNPSNFAYVLPAKPGTRLEPSNDAWFSALDASTRPLIMPPPPPPYTGGGDDDDGPGCCAASYDSLAFSDGKGSAGRGAEEPVQVVEQAVVGPYETVTLRSTDPEALQKWLVDHDYAIPAISGPIIAQYVQNGFDFIALRMQPSQAERQIEPIRIVSPGADPSLPLRLMQIGGAAKIGITLFVIGEGRYHTKNFPEGAPAIDKLIWDTSQNRSNYQELSLRKMEEAEGRTFITEYAKKPDLSESGAPPPIGGRGMTGNPALGAAYAQGCGPQVPQRPLPPIDPVPDAGVGDVDAGAVGDAGGDAGEDAGSNNGDGEKKPDAGKGPQNRQAICDDLNAATDGMVGSDIWITRMRGNLPNPALNDTLILEPAPQQLAVENVYQTTKNGSVNQARISPSRARWKHGTYALIAFTAFVLGRLLRKKKQQS